MYETCISLNDLSKLLTAAEQTLKWRQNDGRTGRGEIARNISEDCQKY